MELIKDYNEIKNKIIQIRREIHKNPELSFEEANTSSVVCAFLEEFGIPYKKGIAKTGVCAFIGKDRGKTFLIRADMDALPVCENTGLEYASKSPGIMHSCGHDLHTSSALAACYILKKHEKELNGRVKVVFQPGEETTGGAKPMIDEGIMENPRVDLCLGAHVSAMYDTGDVLIKEGALMASPDDFKVETEGKSAHGAEPENGINPIDAATYFAVKIKEEIEKNIDMTKNIFTICSFNSGTTNNIIPQKAVVEGTFRSFCQEDREKAHKLIGAVADKADKKYKTKTKVTYNYLYPPVINDGKVTEAVRKFAQGEFGKDKVKELGSPFMTGEDFSYYAKEAPSAFVWVGCKGTKPPCPLHSPLFDPDEDAIETIARLFAGFAIEYLK